MKLVVDILNQYAIVTITSANNQQVFIMTNLQIIQNILSNNNVESNTNSATMYLNESNRVFDADVSFDTLSDSECFDRDAMIEIYEYNCSWDHNQ